MSLFEYFHENIFSILERTLEHLQITVLSVGIAVLIGIPLGVILTRFPKTAPPVQYLLSIMQTIPSLALLGFLIPFVGIGVKPSIITLVIYSLLVIVQNTTAGIYSIDPSVIESAQGVGMTKFQIIYKVKIPLALPVIIAGVRVATITSVGITTLVAAIGAGGLGTFIYRGINVLNNNLILAGAIPAALLAIILDTLLVIIEKNIIRK